MKRRTCLLAGLAVTAALASAAWPLSRVLVWNVTASVPTGLYHIRGKASLYVGERVAIDPPPGLRRYLADRGYLPSRVPLLKEVAALGGDRVCRTGDAITVNSARLGVARTHDSKGRALPSWQGCVKLAAEQIFVMNRHAPGSFDGRYFGPISRAQVIGRASPVWTDEAGEGDHVWFARPHLSHSSSTKKETNP